MPEPETTLFRVPPLRIKSPELATLPPTLEALIVKPPAEVIDIACEIAELLVTSPVTFVVPEPETALFNVPPDKLRVLLLVTNPLILSAFVLIIPELVTTPLSEPNAALLVKVTPEFTFTF